MDSLFVSDFSVLLISLTEIKIFFVLIAAFLVLP